MILHSGRMFSILFEAEKTHRKVKGNKKRKLDRDAGEVQQHIVSF